MQNKSLRASREKTYKITRISLEDKPSLSCRYTISAFFHTNESMCFSQYELCPLYKVTYVRIFLTY